MTIYKGFLLLLLIPGARLTLAQSTGATFGDVIRLGGTPSDIVLDESRSRLYLVNTNTNQVNIYDYVNNALTSSVNVGTTPVAAAISMDRRYLYVSNNGSSTLSVIDLTSSQVIQTVSLPSNPEGVQVGADGRALITVEGSGTSTSITSLYLFDQTATTGQQLTTIQFSPPPPTPTSLPQVTLTKPTTTFRGKLIRTPDGAFIIGMSTINSNVQTVLFVYQTASASILRSRTVTGQSTILSIAPDGSRFMAGFTLYDTATLGVIAQHSANNLPFPLSSSSSASFSTVADVGGSAFSPDGATLYSAFNSAPSSTPSTQAQASTLLISRSDNLATTLGIKLPESIIAKMVILADATQAWGLSQSGLMHLPLGSLYDYPILQPASTTVFLSNDSCSAGQGGFALPVNNLGGGKLTFSVPQADASLTAQVNTGVTPGIITLTMEPGRTGVTRQYGTNLYSGGGASNSGTAVNINLASPEAINIPNTIRVYMNNRLSDQRGVIFPLPTTPTNTEGLQDIQFDPKRNRIYIANSGYNRIEVFDIASGQFLDSIAVGQFPHQMALDGDAKTLWVANSGGESITGVDLDQGLVNTSVQFPAIPRSGTTNPVTPQALIWGYSGVEFIKSDGSQWEVVNGSAILRPTNSVTPVDIATSSTEGAVRMVSSSSGQAAIVLGGAGTAYLYNALANAFTVANGLYSSTTIPGYFGPLAAAPDASYFLANGLVLNSSLSVIGGAQSTSLASSNPAPFASTRNVVAVAALDRNSFLRLTTQAKTSLTATTAVGDSRPTLELANLQTNAVTVAGAVAENPAVTVFGTTRANVPPRLLAVDASGNAYALTLSGLSVIPLTPQGSPPPQIASGANAIVNSSDGTTKFAPGSFIAVNGANLASSGKASQLPAPTVLGGSCVTVGSLAIPLLQTSAGQISAQLPGNLRPGMYATQVRSLANGQQSQSVVITVGQ
jgi:YVTN family beta-propeller protein